MTVIVSLVYMSCAFDIGDRMDQWFHIQAVCTVWRAATSQYKYCSSYITDWSAGAAWVCVCAWLPWQPFPGLTLALLSGDWDGAGLPPAMIVSMGPSWYQQQWGSHSPSMCWYMLSYNTDVSGWFCLCVSQLHLALPPPVTMGSLLWTLGYI